MSKRRRFTFDCHYAARIGNRPQVFIAELFGRYQDEQH